MLFKMVRLVSRPVVDIPVAGTPVVGTPVVFTPVVFTPMVGTPVVVGAIFYFRINIEACYQRSKKSWCCRYKRCNSLD